jgi:hypothetical protein
LRKVKKTLTFRIYLGIINRKLVSHNRDPPSFVPDQTAHRASLRWAVFSWGIHVDGQDGQDKREKLARGKLWSVCRSGEFTSPVLNLESGILNPPRVPRGLRFDRQS